MSTIGNEHEAFALDSPLGQEIGGVPRPPTGPEGLAIPFQEDPAGSLRPAVDGLDPRLQESPLRFIQDFALTAAASTAAPSLGAVPQA